ncbi:hypothetical protein [Salarchaeum sp. JOR-1]|uniref:DUF5789 family protein n=1 Tax=Salarchaeum sp. JOR-1 TaxID=2599399 RepID=UPI001198328F|nr:hypothetical protein [Salarchaeum sp. JOR-1]QDX39460.1 hypothetical protein FQU85_00675 [Salarchaeum sp. JOR-1]
MRLQDVREYVDRELTYPIDSDRVREHVGDLTVDAPTADASRTVGDLLPAGNDTYESPAALANTLTANLPDEYVGRKYYDDRGPNIDADGPRDEENQSF